MSENEEQKDGTNVSDSTFHTEIIVPVTETTKDLSEAEGRAVELTEGVSDLQDNADQTLAEILKEAEKRIDSLFPAIEIGNDTSAGEEVSLEFTEGFSDLPANIEQRWVAHLKEAENREQYLEYIYYPPMMGGGGTGGPDDW